MGRGGRSGAAATVVAADRRAALRRGAAPADAPAGPDVVGWERVGRAHAERAVLWLGAVHGVAPVATGAAGARSVHGTASALVAALGDSAPGPPERAIPPGVWAWRVGEAPLDGALADSGWAPRTWGAALNAALAGPCGVPLDPGPWAPGAAAPGQWTRLLVLAAPALPALPALPAYVLGLPFVVPGDTTGVGRGDTPIAPAGLRALFGRFPVGFWWHSYSPVPPGG